MRRDVQEFLGHEEGDEGHDLKVGNDFLNSSQTSGLRYEAG